MGKIYDAFLDALLITSLIFVVVLVSGFVICILVTLVALVTLHPIYWFIPLIFTIIFIICLIRQ